MSAYQVDVVFDVRSAGAQGVYSYVAPSALATGTAVLAPLGSRRMLGYVIGIGPVDEALRAKLREVEVVDGLRIPSALVEVLIHLAGRTLCSLPVAVSAMFPPSIAERVVDQWTSTGEGTGELSALQRTVLEGMQAAPMRDSKSKKLSAPVKKALNLLAEKGYVRRSSHLSTPRSRKSILLRLNPDASKIEAFLKSQGKKKPAQALTLIRLQQSEMSAIAPADVRALSGVTDQTIKALMAEGLLEEVDEMSFKPTSAPKIPNDEQQAAIQAISSAIGTHQFQSFLLHGVTGSGKTEVFLQCAAQALMAGRSVLYLVPEIALASQAVVQLRERFGDRVALIHSELAKGERLEMWSRIQNGSTALVLGARSALFAPLHNIGLIIVDEEHEPAYKQESSPRYHAKDVSLMLGEAHGATVVLGSATPSLETFQEATRGKHTLLRLTRRAARASLPEVLLDDLTEGYRRGAPAIIAPLLQEEIDAVLDRGEQAILFLNRRSYSPSMICKECGHTFNCPRCAVSLSYSRRSGKLRCHHCDFSMVAPLECPQCRGVRLQPIGIGTEKLEEMVQSQFPRARTARMDRDVSQRKGALDEVLTQFRLLELDILIGTQMVAKGLDFPNVTLVGVIAADLSLSLPDFRASERTFQLLAQVAGRAGRGDRPGKVIVQTFNPEHIALVCARDHDFERFAAHSIVEREQAKYPPYCQLVNIIVSGEHHAPVVEVSYQVAVALETLGGMEVLGPADAAIEKLHNRWRRQILVKVPLGSDVAPIGEALQKVGEKGVHLMIDVNPYSLI